MIANKKPTPRSTRTLAAVFGGLIALEITAAALTAACKRAGGATPLPAPIAVCVEVGDGRGRIWASASPSRAGVYDPAQPPVPEELNWTVAGFGCVKYPAPALPHIVCDPSHPAAPLVSRQPCSQ